MIFNCLHCGISISTKKQNCTYCKTNNSEIIEMLTGVAPKALPRERFQWRERMKGTIFAYVMR